METSSHPLTVWVHVDRVAGAAYLQFVDDIGPGDVSRTENNSDDTEISLDFDASGKLLGLEALESSCLPDFIVEAAARSGDAGRTSLDLHMEVRTLADSAKIYFMPKRLVTDDFRASRNWGGKDIGIALLMDKDSKVARMDVRPVSRLLSLSTG